MKKLLSIVLVIALVLGMSAVTALAVDAPPYNGNISGVITSNDAGHIAGSVTGAYDLIIDGNFTSTFVGQKATFSGTVSGDIEGTVTGIICVNGLDSLYGVITTTATTDPVRIVGSFVQSGIAGDFRGKIVTGALPAAVTSLSIESPDTTMRTGSTMQMSTTIAPSGSYDVLWAIWVNQGDKAWIDQNGLLHALKPGTVTVIANTLDPSLATVTKNITIVDPVTEVKAGVDPTYTIVIPASVDFGSLVKDSGVITREFDVSASGVIIEAGASIDVNVTGPFAMSDEDGEGDVELPFALSNEAGTITAGTFAHFTGGNTEDGNVSVNTGAITKAGSYKGTMVFSIVYNG